MLPDIVAQGPVGSQVQLSAAIGGLTRALEGDRVLAASATKPPVTGTAVLCSILDARYVEWESSTVGRLPDDSDVPVPLPGVGYEYYIGDGPGGILDPDGAYDPNAFDCSLPDAGWVTTVPAGAEVRAVRATLTTTTSEANAGHNLLFLFTWQRVRPGFPIGQDIWFWTSFSDDGGATWFHPHRDSVPDPAATPTPTARYAYAYAGRIHERPLDDDVRPGGHGRARHRARAAAVGRARVRHHGRDERREPRGPLREPRHARAGTTQLIVRTSSAFALGLTALVAARVRVRRTTRED
ncbi:MAG: hypothetical protein EAS51_06465 [Microbacteriaceae bacterium]|nr:MAG: hypothetical protein EAS51_06465 [Microbacteriaceae bacterium]